MNSKNKWIISGLLTFLLGVVLLFTMVLTAPGLLLIVVGVGIMASAYLRIGKTPRS